MYHKVRPKSLQNEKYHPQLAADNVTELADKLLAFGGLLLYPFDSYSTVNQELQNLNDLLVYKYGNGTYPTRNIIRRLAPKCDDIIKRCVLKGKVLKCSEVFFLRTTTSGVCCLFNYRRVSYTDDKELHEREVRAYNKSSKIHFDASGYLNSLQLVLQDNPDDYTLKEYPSDVFRVLLFYPENYPDTEIGSVIRTLVAYNEETEISIQPEILEGSDRMRQFSAKMRHCYFLEEGQQLLQQKFYSFSECILNCRTISVVNHCGCVVPVLPGFIGGVPYCVLIDVPCIALWKSIWWQWNAFDYVSEKRQPQPTLELCKHCLPSCDVVSYKANVNSRPLNIPPNGANFSAGLLNGLSPTKPTTAIRFFYQSAFSQVKTHDISGDWVVLLGRYGGICSVMYGFSIVAIIELLYFVTGKWFALWWKAIVQCYRNRQLRKVASAKHQDLYWNELKPKGAFAMREKLNDF
ncbi:sodium channel protein Nach [Eupeodes corollae]|uniref:sodium channel protein Nach n=1 Tax=Eupeodes corollae TaxID=290404 RepID=UPI002492B73B|nr:sodium channel protein Nach [Eupeodes corollae]